MATAVMGLTAASATAASTFVGNGSGTGVLDAALIAAGWVFVEATPAATQGTTADWLVWRNATSTIYVGIGYDNTTNNGQLLFVASESYNTGTHKWNQPVDGHATNTSVAPTVNFTVTDTEQTINAHSTNMGYIRLNAPQVGFLYLYKLEANFLTIATYSAATIAAADAARSTYVQVGHFTPLSTAFVDTHPLMLHGPAGTAVGTTTSWSTTSGSAANSAVIRTSRALGIAASTNSPFCFQPDFIFPNRTQGTSYVDTAYMLLGFGAMTPPNYINNLCGQVYLWSNTGTAQHGQNALRGAIPGTVMALAFTTSTGELNKPHMGTTVNIDGDLYYGLGGSPYVGGSAYAGAIGTGLSSPQPTLYIKAT